MDRSDIRIKKLSVLGNQTEIQAELTIIMRTRTPILGSHYDDYCNHDLQELLKDRIVQICRNFDHNTLKKHNKSIISEALHQFNMQRLSSVSSEKGPAAAEMTSDRILNIFDFEDWVKREY
jgi:hypothetical protein